MSKPARSGRWMLPVGIVLVIASIAVAAVAGAQSQRLSALVVSSPAPGMVATAIGNGGAAATQVEAAAKGLRPATGLGYVPTTPPIYLEPRQLTLNGRPDGTGPAYWKVWWDGQSQVKAGVSLQQSTTDAYERQGLAHSRRRPRASTRTIHRSASRTCQAPPDTVSRAQAATRSWRPCSATARISPWSR